MLDFADLRKESRQFSNWQSFATAYNMGYIGLYWRFVKAVDPSTVWEHVGEEPLITPFPRIGLTRYATYKYLARIDLTQCEHGIDTNPSERFPGWIVVCNRAKVRVREILPVDAACNKADYYLDRAPKTEQDLRHFFARARDAHAHLSPACT